MKKAIKNLIYKIVGFPCFIRRIELNTIKQFVGKFDNKIVLDVGCGDALLCKNYKKWGAKKIIGIDINKDIIKTGITMLNVNDIYLLQGNAEKIPIKSKSIDIIISNCAIEHMENDIQVFKEIYRILKSDGIFIFTVPYNIEKRKLPIMTFMLRMPKFVKKLLAPHCIYTSNSYEEALWKIKKDKFKEIRNYSIEEIKRKLDDVNLTFIDYENLFKFFGKLCIDLINSIKFLHYNKGAMLIFPILYMLSLSDKLLPKYYPGLEVAVKAKKYF